VLARYANCALTYQVVERIFNEVRGMCFGIYNPLISIACG
jgi:hypothetical protein